MEQKDHYQQLANLIKQYTPSFEYSSPRDTSPEEVRAISAFAWVAMEDRGIRRERTLDEIEERTKEKLEQLDHHRLRKRINTPIPGTDEADELSLSIFPKGNPPENFNETPTTIFGEIEIPIFESKEIRPHSDDQMRSLCSAVYALDRVPADYVDLHREGFRMGQAGLMLHFDDYQKPENSYFRGRITFSKEHQTIEELIKTLQFLERFPQI